MPLDRPIDSSIKTEIFSPDQCVCICLCVCVRLNLAVGGVRCVRVHFTWSDRVYEPIKSSGIKVTQYCEVKWQTERRSGRRGRRERKATRFIKTGWSLTLSLPLSLTHSLSLGAHAPRACTQQQQRQQHRGSDQYAKSPERI